MFFVGMFLVLILSLCFNFFVVARFASSYVSFAIVDALFILFGFCFVS